MAIDSSPANSPVDLGVALGPGIRTPEDVVEPGKSHRRRRVSRVAVGVASILVFSAAFGPIVAPSPTKIDLAKRLAKPIGFGGSWAHPLGTDGLGRDMFANLLAGARVSVVVGLGAVLLAAVIGIPLGLLAGYRGGVIDSAVSWLVDFQLGFPALLLILLVLAYVQSGVVPLIIMLGLVTWMLFARLARSLASSLRASDFVAGAQLAGSRTTKVLVRHLLPNMTQPLITLAFLEVAVVTLGESSLSYLGYGISRPSVSWGLMISEGEEYLRTGWWIVTFPGILLTTSVLTYHALARSVRPAGLFTTPPR